MNQLWNLTKKELRELLTPASLASVIAVCVILIVLGSVVGGQINKSSELQPVGIIDETSIQYEFDSDTYSSAAIKQLESYYSGRYPSSPVSDYVIKTTIPDQTDTNAILNFMKEKKIDTCVVIPKGFNENMERYLNGQGAQPCFTIYYNQTNTSAFSAMSTATGTMAYSQMNLGMTYKIMEDKGISKTEASKLLSPSAYTDNTFFNGQIHLDTNPAVITSAISAQTMFVPMIIMLIIVMIGSILISSMGNEKENKTLETLLTLPISRTKVVAGKLLGCAISGLIMGAIYMIGMYFYINSFSAAASGKSAAELGLALNGLDWVVVAVFIFLAIMCALGMCMILGAFAKNYKAAQTYVMPISVLAVIPMFVTMFSSYTELPLVLQVILFIIPFTHPMMILPNIMFGNWALIIAGGIYLLLFAVAMIYITVRLYNSDILLTGWLKKNDDKKGKMSWSDLFNKNKN